MEKYCKEINRKPHRKDVNGMAWNARKHRTVCFYALYYKRKVVGFIYRDGIEINYVLPEYKNLNLDNGIRNDNEKSNSNRLSRKRENNLCRKT